MSNNVISALEEQFNKDCKIINIRYEYEGFSGKERYIIASCLTEKEIWNKYPKQAKLYAPFVRVDLSFIEVRQKYINNEDKFCKRANFPDTLDNNNLLKTLSQIKRDNKKIITNFDDICQNK